MPAIPIPEYKQQVGTPRNVPRLDVYQAPTVYDTSSGLRNAANVLADTIQHENTRRDQRDLLDYDVKLTQLQQKYLIGDDQAPGALQQQGRNAEGVTRNALAGWDKEVAAITPKLRTPEAQARARQAMITRREDMNNRLWTHEIGQGKKADDEARTAAIQTYTADSIASADDLAAVDANLARIRGVVMDKAKAEGWDPKTKIPQELADAESATLAAVIKAQLAKDSTLALSTFRARADHLRGNDRIAIESTLRPYELDVVGRSLGDSDWSRSGGVPSAPGDFEGAAAAVMQTEGGFVADDAGKGPTNFGINQSANPDVDVKSLTPLQAKALYRERYWDAIGADSLPEGLRMQAFDAAVNQGVAWTQKALGIANGDPAKFAELRRARYRELIASNPSKYGKYEKSWMARVDSSAGAPIGTPAQPWNSFTDPVKAAAAIDAQEAKAMALADQDPIAEQRQARQERIRYQAQQAKLQVQAMQRTAQADRDALDSQYDNVIAKLSDGINVPTAERPTRDQLIAAHGDVKGDALYQQLQATARVGSDVVLLRTASIEEASKILAGYKADPNSTQYALDKQAETAIGAAWDKINKARQEDPMQFALQNGLYSVGALDPSNPGDQWQKRDNAARLMNQRYGTGYRLMSNAEAAAYSNALAKATAPEKLQALSQARDALSATGFQSVMGQVAADQPLTAAAGSLLGVADRSLALDSGRTLTGAQVATTILAGQELLNPPKGGAKVDLAADAKLQEAFSAYVGTAYAGHPKAQQQAFNAFRAYYAARAGDLGQLGSKEINSEIADEAALAVTGGVADVNGKDLVLPWGMGEDAFTDAAEKAWPQFAALAGLPDSTPFDKITFTPANAFDQFYLMAGDTPLVNKDTHQPLIMTVKSRAKADTSDSGAGSVPRLGMVRPGHE